MGKIQYGGFAGVVATIGKFTVNIVISIFKTLYSSLRSIFYFWPNKKYKWYNLPKWKIGHLWIYMWYCFKTCIYLMLFVFGGPVVIIFGIAYLYMKLYSKLGERNDAITNKNDTNKNDTNN